MRRRRYKTVGCGCICQIRLILACVLISYLRMAEAAPKAVSDTDSVTSYVQSNTSRTQFLDITGPSNSGGSCKEKQHNGSLDGDEIKHIFQKLDRKLKNTILDCEQQICTCFQSLDIQDTFKGILAIKKELFDTLSDTEEILSHAEFVKFTEQYELRQNEVCALSVKVESKVEKLLDNNSGSRRGSSKSSRSRRSAGSSSSKASNKDELFELQKDVAAMEAEIKFHQENLQQEMQLKLQKEEHLQQELQLKLQKELAEKKARAKVCMMVEEVQNPFSVDTDLISRMEGQSERIWNPMKFQVIES